MRDSFPSSFVADARIFLLSQWKLVAFHLHIPSKTNASFPRRTHPRRPRKLILGNVSSTRLIPHFPIINPIPFSFLQDGWGGRNGTTKPQPMLRIQHSGRFSNVQLLNTPARAISIGGNGLVVSDVHVNNGELFLSLFWSPVRAPYLTLLDCHQLRAIKGTASLVPDRQGIIQMDSTFRR